MSEEKEVIEKLDVKQGKLNIGYRTNISMATQIILLCKYLMDFWRFFSFQIIYQCSGKSKSRLLCL